MSISCPLTVHRMSIGCPQDAHRMSTSCPQDAHKLSTRCPQVVHRMCTRYPHVSTTLMMTFFKFPVRLEKWIVWICRIWQCYLHPFHWRSVLAGSGAFVHHGTASQLSWHVSPAAGALCERGALLGDTTKSTPHFKAAVGMNLKTRPTLHAQCL